MEHCLNCGEPLTKRYCPECGQEALPSALPLRMLLHELADHLFSFDSKLFITLRSLITRPGALTVEYLAGRRVRYLAPFRIYVTLSALFFLGVGMRSQGLENGQNGGLRISSANKLPKRSSSVGSAMSLVQVSGDNKHAPTGLENLPDSSEELERQVTAEGKTLNALDRYLIQHVVRLKKVGVKGLMDKLISNFPLMMFLLLPLFAFAFKLVYRRSGRLYMEHLVFLLHCHAMAYLVFSAAFLPYASKLTPLLSVVLVVYFFLAMRRVYNQSVGKTLLKMWLLLHCYFFIFLLCFVFVGLLAFLQV